MIVLAPTRLVKAGFGVPIGEVCVFGCKRLVASEMNLDMKVVGRTEAGVGQCGGIESYDCTEFSPSLKGPGQEDRSSFAVCYLLYVSGSLWLVT